MCCPTTYHPIDRHCAGMPAANCGCGCLGKEGAAWYLENRREHLKAELTSVENQIQAVRQDDK